MTRDLALYGPPGAVSNGFSVRGLDPMKEVLLDGKYKPREFALDVPPLLGPGTFRPVYRRALRYRACVAALSLWEFQELRLRQLATRTRLSPADPPVAREA